MSLPSRIIPFRLHPLGFIECFVNLGAKLDALLVNTGINSRMIAHGDGAISYKQQDTLIENGLRLCKSKNLGLRVGSLMDWSYHGSAGSVVSCSTQLKDAWNVFLRFLCTAQPEYLHKDFEKSFYVTKQQRIVEPITGFSRHIKHPKIAQFELEFMLAISLRLCDLCGNKSIEENKVLVSLAYPKPKDLSAYDALPCDDIMFSQRETAISVHVDFVTQTWRPFRQPSFDKLVGLCEQELKQSDPAIQTSHHTRWLIGTNYFNKQLTLEDIAEKLNLTPRTLTRRLANENTSFRAIFYHVRMQLTVHHLQKSDLSLESLARLMRFSSVASLRRAIKNYSGDTIATLRRKELSQQHMGQQTADSNVKLSSPVKYSNASSLTPPY